MFISLPGIHYCSVHQDCFLYCWKSKGGERGSCSLPIKKIKSRKEIILEICGVPTEPSYGTLGVGVPSWGSLSHWWCNLRMNTKGILRTKNRFRQKLMDSLLEFERKTPAQQAVALPGAWRGRVERVRWCGGRHVAGQRDLRDRQSEEAQSIRSLRAHLASGQHPEREKKTERRKRNNYTFRGQVSERWNLTGTAPVGEGSRKERCMLSFFNW